MHRAGHILRHDGLCRAVVTNLGLTRQVEGSRTGRRPFLRPCAFDSLRAPEPLAVPPNGSDGEREVKRILSTTIAILLKDSLGFLGISSDQAVIRQ